MDEELKFGFLPDHVLQSISDLGNWKNRSAAIEEVQLGLHNLSNKAQLLEQLPEFVEFVVQLLEDHNFKIATAGLHILADLAAACGSVLQPHLSVLASAIYDKLLDPREAVTAAAIKACASLMMRCLPSSPMPLLSRLLQQHEQQQAENSNAAQQPDCSGMLEVLILAQLKYDASKLDVQSAVGTLLAAIASGHAKQQALALESLALATDALGTQLADSLRQSGAEEVDITDILQKTRTLHRPQLLANGTVRHGVEVLAAAAVSTNNDMSASFSLKAYGSNSGLSRTVPATDGSSFSSSDLKFASLKLRSDSIGSISSSTGPPSPKNKLMWTAPVGGGSLGRSTGAAQQDEQYQQPAQDQQLLPPGSLSALAAHAQLIQHASASRHDPSSSSWQSSSNNAANSIDSRTGALIPPPEGSSLNSIRGAPGGWGASGSGGARTSLAQKTQSSIEYREETVSSVTGTSGVPSSLRTSLGSSSSIAAAAAAAGTGNSLNNSLSSSLKGGTGASNAAVASGQFRIDLPKSRFYGEEPGIEQQQVNSQQYASPLSPGSQGGVAGGQFNRSSNSRYEQQQQQGAADSNGTNQALRSGVRDSSNTAGGAPYSSPLGSYTGSQSTGQGQPLSAAAAGDSGPGSSSWTAAGGAGWALVGGEADSPSTSGRADALSPSRGERLAQLKRRQNEKRGASAAGGSRADPRDYIGSPDSSYSPSYASGPAAGTPFQATPVSGTNSSWASGSSDRTNGYMQSPAPASAPTSLLHWNLHTAPAGRPIVQQQQPHPHNEQQQVPTSGLMHLRSAPIGYFPESVRVEATGRPVAESFVAAGAYSAVSHSAKGSHELAVPGRHTAGSLSAAAAQPSTYSPSSIRSTVSAAAVLTGAVAETYDSSAESNSSPTIRQRRLGPGGALGVQQPASASPEYPGASRAAAVNRRADNSPALGAAAGNPAHLRAQTAAAAVGMNSDWGGTGSPVAGTASPSVKRGGYSDRPQSVAPDGEMGADLAPMSDPETSLRKTIIKLQQSNTAARKELDWQGQLDALIDARRLLAHHSEVVGTAAHELILAALPAVEELRSTTARVALLLFQELPAVLGRSLERELDDIVPVLLKKAGELSTAGRDNFLASEADKALSGLWSVVAESRAFTALIAAGVQHKSPHVRCRAAAHLDEVAAGGAGLEPLVRGNWSVLERTFKAAAGFLQEGSLDTRTYGKRLLWAVKAAVRGNRGDLDRLLAAITPEASQRRVIEVLENLSAPPPAPASKIGAATAASRGSSRGPGTPTPGQYGGSSATSSPATPSSSYGAAAAASNTPPGSASRSGHSVASNGRVRRQLLPSGSISSGDGSSNKLAPAGGGAMPVDSPPKRRNRVSTDGAPTGSSSAAGNNSSAMPSPIPAGPGGLMSPELQEAVEQVGLHMASKDWRSRSDALAALAALLPALPEVPNGPLEELLNGLVARLSDGNAKVNVQALQVLTDVFGMVEARTQLIMPSLLPALASNLGSSNQQIRSTATTAMDALVAVVPPGHLLQSLSHIVMHSSSVKSKVILVEKLGGLLPQVYRYQPQVVVKQVLPTAFALAQEARGELKPPAVQLLTILVQLMGASALLGHAAGVSSAVESKVRDLLPTGWA